MKRLRNIPKILICMALATALVCPQRAAASSPTDGLTEKETSLGQKNIVKRAQQFMEIQWTPQGDVSGWNAQFVFEADTQYTGVPYGQPVHTSGYIGFDISIEDFVNAVTNPDSCFYTSYSYYNKQAPYYSVDCSSFVSYAWGLSSRENSSSLAAVGEWVDDQSVDGLEVGDCLDLPESHVVLVSGVWQNAQGKVAAVEIWEQNTSGPCRTLYADGSDHPLEQLTQLYFDSGYRAYRNPNRDQTKYVHSCAVPLEGDVCRLCGVGIKNDTVQRPLSLWNQYHAAQLVPISQAAWNAYLGLSTSLGLVSSASETTFFPAGILTNSLFLTTLNRTAEAGSA